MKLHKKQILLVSFMLFSLFFGAGNLIFPPFLGQNAGSQTPFAIAAFLITAVALPVLGVIVVAKFDGLEGLIRNLPSYLPFLSTFPSAPDLVSPEQPPFPLKWQWLPIFLRKRICPYSCLDFPLCFSSLQDGWLLPQTSW